MNILVVKPDHLGDFALALPALWEAAHANGKTHHLTVLASSGNCEWSNILPWLKSIRPLDHPRYHRGPLLTDSEKIQDIVAATTLAWTFRGQVWDLGIEMTSSRHDFLGKFILRVAGCRKTKGLRGHWDFLLNECCDEGTGHQVQRLAQRFPQELQCNGATDPSVFMPLEYRWTRDSQSPVIISPWAGTRAKSWAWDSWSELISKLRIKEIPFILLAPADLDLIVSRFARQCGVGQSEILRVSTIKETLTLLQRSRAWISMDTGLAHFAWLTGTPGVQLFSGSADPVRWGALGKARRLSFPVSCSPCKLENCNQPHHDCMEGITPQALLDEVSSLLCCK